MANNDSHLASLPLEAIDSQIRAYKAATPREKAVSLASGGVATLAFGIYLATLTPLYAGMSFLDLTVSVVTAPASAPRWMWIPLAGWGLLMLIGVVWLVVGFHRARNLPRDMHAAFWALLPTLMFAALLWWGAYPPARWLDKDLYPLILGATLILKGLYIIGLTEEATKLFLAVRGPGSTARKEAEKNLDDNRIPWNPPPGRRS